MVKQKIFKHSVIAIGNFDGIHKGHQKIFKLGKQLAKKIIQNLVLLPFLPYQMNFFISKKYLLG